MTKKEKKPENGLKERITITIDKELLDWIDKKVEERIFASRSHGLEFLINHAIKEEKNETHE
jgi:metal-responsive CopG/Arc/MetJ family transcriptional regulator